MNLVPARGDADARALAVARFLMVDGWAVLPQRDWNVAADIFIHMLVAPATPQMTAWLSRTRP